MSWTRSSSALLAAQRLRAQRLSKSDQASPATVVAAFGAIQAQDLAGSRWAVGLRLREGAVTERDVETALDSGSLIRTHAMRGTWQLIAPEDVRWILALVGPRTLAKYRSRRQQLGLGPSVLKSCEAILRRGLQRERELTRADIRAALSRAKVPLKDEALSHVLMHAELTGIVCSGARRGKQSTHALLDARLPSQGKRLTGEEAAAELARRYLSTRGPAQVEDFSWWSGLPLTTCRAAFTSLTPRVTKESIDGRTYFALSTPPRRPESRALAHWVPAFDEYLVAYRDRSAMVLPEHALRVNGGGGMLNPCVLVNGRVVGLWKRALSRTRVHLTAHLFEPLSASEERLVTQAADRYAAFLGLEPVLRLEGMRGRLGGNGRWRFSDQAV
jgi:hypothetical protein